MENQVFTEILGEVAELLRREAHPRKGTIALAPETVELLDRIGERGEATEAEPTEPAAAEASPLEPPDVEAELAALAEEVSGCTACALCESRTQTVFSDGSAHAELVFVGEAPGYHEDQQGVPFVGRAGQLLTDIIEKGMKLRRQDVYICNVLKCRPPENRDPSPEEKRKCEPYLVRQLELVKPKVICALGGHAAKTLLRTEEATGRLRGRWHFYHGIPLRVTYHPAYLLRNPSDKRKTWEDIQEVMKVLNGEVTPAPPESGTGLFE